MTLSQHSATGIAVMSDRTDAGRSGGSEVLDRRERKQISREVSILHEGEKSSLGVDETSRRV
jgi:hypothetical protein